MRHVTIVVALAAILTADAPPPYTIAYASFAPLNADIFVANADGSDARPFLPSPAQDWNASFSRDGQWIVFNSTRNGSADIYRAHPDGSGLERLTDDPAFDDQASLSPDGRRLAFVSTRSGQSDIWSLDLKRVRQVASPAMLAATFVPPGRRTAVGSCSRPIAIRPDCGGPMASKRFNAPCSIAGAAATAPISAG